MGKPGSRLGALILAAVLLCALGSAGAAGFALSAPAGPAEAVPQRQWLLSARVQEADTALWAAEPCRQPRPSLAGYQAAFLLAATLFELLFALVLLAEACPLPAHLGAGIRLTYCHIQRAPPPHSPF